MKDFHFLFFISIYIFISFFSLIILLKKQLNSNEFFILISLLIFVKILFLFKSPLLSDDIYRYLWEGKVFLKGFNPYKFPPESGKLSFLRDTIYSKVNHKNLSAIYPPFIILLNALIVKISYSVVFYKFILFLFDITGFTIIIKILHYLKKPIKYSLFYLINPLTTLEIEWNGHNDIIMILFFLLAIYALIKGKTFKAGIYYSFAIFSKFVYLIFANEFSKKFKNYVMLILIGIILYSPFLSGDIHIFSSLKIYLQQWEFNGSLYKLLYIFIKNGFLIRIILAGFFVIYWFFINKYIDNLFKKLTYLIVGLIIVSPTVHPWYGLWLLPFLCFNFYIELYIFLIMLPFSYEILERYLKSGVWHENNFITFIIYIPVIIFILKNLKNRSVNPL